MRTFAIIALLLVSPPVVEVPVTLLAQTVIPLPPPPSAAVQKSETAAAQQASNDYDAVLKQYQTLATEFVTLIGITATLILGSVAVYRDFVNKLKKNHEMVAETAVNAAKEVEKTAVEVAKKTADQFSEVTQKIKDTSDQLQYDGDNTIRSLVKEQGDDIRRQGEDLRIQAQESQKFRGEMSVWIQTIIQSTGGLDARISSMQDMMNTILKSNMQDRKNR